jgi:hypothetical protein
VTVPPQTFNDWSVNVFVGQQPHQTAWGRG